MKDDEFSANLNYLCGFYASIAEVCRRLSINRQQFNKYLSGFSRPSRHNMRRICDFFGVTEAEILLDPARFQEIVSLRKKPMTGSALEAPLRHLETLYQASGSLDRYLGYYYRYFYSFGYANKVIKSLGVLYKVDDKYYWKNVEVFREGRRRLGTDVHVGVSKYSGVALLLNNRIFIVEYETLVHRSITQMTLYPSYESQFHLLPGIQTGGPTRRGRKPAASRVLLEYVGRRVNLRNALSSIGLFDPSAINPEILRLIENNVPTGSYVLEVEEP